MDVPENIHPEFRNQFPSDPENQIALKISETAFGDIEDDENQWNGIQHEGIFFNKNFIQSFFNQGNGGCGKSAHDDRGHQHQDNFTFIGNEIADQAFIEF